MSKKNGADMFEELLKGNHGIGSGKSGLSEGLSGLLKRLAEMADSSGGTEVGTASPENLARFKTYKREKQKLNDDVYVETERLSREASRRMDELFEDRTEALSKEKSDIWKAICAELGLPEDASLNIDTRTGVVTRTDK